MSRWAKCSFRISCTTPLGSPLKPMPGTRQVDGVQGVLASEFGQLLNAVPKEIEIGRFASVVLDREANQPPLLIPHHTASAPLDRQAEKAGQLRIEDVRLLGDATAHDGATIPVDRQVGRHHALDARLPEIPLDRPHTGVTPSVVV